MTAWMVALFGVCGLWLLLWRLRLREWALTQQHVAVSSRGDMDASCVVPARDEEANVSGCLASLRGQGREAMEIIVVDDASTDRTAECVLKASQQDPRVRLMRCAASQEGWLGKTWALTCGAEASSAAWLIFCDADTILDPDALSTACHMIEDEHLDCLSIIPQMESSKLSVSVLLSCLALARAILFRPASPGKCGMVQGGFLAVRRSAFDAVGGFRKLRGSLLEDVELGNALHHAGFRVRAQPSSPWVRTVMYGSFAEAWQGICKHLYPAMEYSVFRMMMAATAYIALVVFPVVSFVMGARMMLRGDTQSVATSLTVAALAALLVMYGVMGRVLARESLSRFSLALAPFSFVLFAALGLHSAHAYTHGHVSWKGRRYAGACTSRGGAAAGVDAADASSRAMRCI